MNSGRIVRGKHSGRECGKSRPGFRLRVVSAKSRLGDMASEKAGNNEGVQVSKVT